MTIDYGGRDLTFLAAEDLSDMQYRFVVQASDTQVQMANAATDFPLGILQNAPESGEKAVVRVDGTSKLVMNAAYSVGQALINEYVGASDNGKGTRILSVGRSARLFCSASDDPWVSHLRMNGSSLTSPSLTAAARLSSD